LTRLFGGKQCIFNVWTDSLIPPWCDCCIFLWRCIVKCWTFYYHSWVHLSINLWHMELVYSYTTNSIESMTISCSLLKYVYCLFCGLNDFM
jgi:hypothetical protein